MTSKLEKFAAETIDFRSRARYHHWNAQGPTFPQDHEYFEELYHLLDDEVDQAAEWARTYGHTFPSEIQLADRIPDDATGPDPEDPWEDVFSFNKTHINRLEWLRFQAEEADNTAIVVGTEDWIQKHEDVAFYAGSILGKF